MLITTGHLVQVNIGVEHPLFKFMYSFHMPLFMALSGSVDFLTTRITSLKALCQGIKKEDDIISPIFLIVYPC